MKRVLYVATSPSHKRALESFVEHPDMVQAVAWPSKENSTFSINKVYNYSNKKELQGIVDSFKPNIYAQASLPCADGIKLPQKCKKVYISHGLVANYVKNMIKPAGFNTSAWKGCDLYCGAWDKVFTDWIKHAAKVNEDKILLNALPQLDILHGGIQHHRKQVRKDFSTKKSNRVVLFFGFCCKDRLDCNNHNEDYFHTAIKLSSLSKKLDFLTYIKPRQEKSRLLNYLKRKNKSILNEYRLIEKNRERVKFIGPTQGHVLNYYFSDVFITNGCSTAEIEACALEKPLFVVRTKENLKHGYDPYDTVKSGAAVEITSVNDLEQKLEEYFKYGEHHYPDRQKRLLSNMGITFDGKAHKRIQDKMLDL